MFKKYLGSKILSELNDLKRTVDTASVEIGIDKELLQKAILGQLSENEMEDIIDAICSSYPVERSTFFIEKINSSDRFVHFKAKDALPTSRIYKRSNSENKKTNYYEYRDSAMSRLSKFRPEWIKQLRFVDNNDPYNLDVVYNNGHFMHQITFFVGPVNFYYKDGKESYCIEMETGDSNYIPPYIPHSFTSRNPNKEAFIVAVTFGGKLKEVLPKITALNNNLSIYINNIIKNGNNIEIKKDSVSSIKEFKTNKFPMKCSDDHSNKLEVLIKKKKDYELVQNSVYAASSTSRYFSGARGFHIVSKSNEELNLTSPCDSFLFNYGITSTELENFTVGKKIAVEHGDSVFVTAGDEYSLKLKPACSLFLVTLDLYLTPDLINEITAFSECERLYAETEQWFQK